MCEYTRDLNDPARHIDIQNGLFLQVSLTKNLEIANIGYRVRPNILRADLEARKHVTEEF